MDPMIMVFGGIAIILMFVLGSFMAALYTKVGPNQALIVSGGGAAPKVIVGGGTVVLPLVNKKQFLSLELMSIDLKNTSPILTTDCAGIYLDAVIEAQFNCDETSIMAAAKNFGDKDLRQVRSIISDTVFDHARRIINNNKRSTIVDRISQFAEEVRNAAHQELAPLGISLHAFRVKDIREVRTSVNVIDPTSSSTSLPQLTNGKNNDLTGRIAMVTETITSDNAGQITYELQGGLSRKTIAARTPLIGCTITSGTTVVIVRSEGESVFVEPWSQVHASMPEKIC